MAAIVDEAIVIALAEYSETSQIVKLFGRTTGKLELIAKGIRRSTKKRFAPGLDLLEQGEVRGYPPGRDSTLGTLTEWHQHNPHKRLRATQLGIYGGCYAAERIAALTEAYDPHPGLFEALEALFEALSAAPPQPGAVVRFQAALLRAIGYAPLLRTCASCRRSRAAKKAAFFSPAAGGYVCATCAPDQRDAFRISGGMLDAPRASQSPRAWFTLLDRYMTALANRPSRAAKPLSPLLDGNHPHASDFGQND